jgi:hypothetical protein
MRAAPPFPLLRSGFPRTARIRVVRARASFSNCTPRTLGSALWDSLHFEPTTPRNISAITSHELRGEDQEEENSSSEQERNR